MLRCSLWMAGLLPVPLALAAPVCLRAQTPERVPLTGTIVALTLAQAGVHVDAQAIELPASLSSTAVDPQLRITGAELLADGRLRVRLACRQTSECHPFLATLRPASTPESMADFLSLQTSLPSARSTQPNDGTERVLAGQRATLFFEDTHMRITLPVLVIDSGAPGSEVRVSTLDRKQTFRALVAGPGTLRGTLP
jgi:hypothetical protein